jgi:hypothetical protein
MTVNVCQATVDAVVAERQTRVIDTQQVQYGGVQVVAPDGIESFPSPFVTLAMCNSAFDSGPRQP